MKRPFALSTILALTLLPSSFAASSTSEPCDPTKAATPEPVSDSVKNVFEKIKAAKNSLDVPLIEGSFRFSAVKQDGYVKAQSFTPNYAASSYRLAYDLLSATTGKWTAFNLIGAPAKTFDQSMDILRKQAPGMSTDEKLLYLSMLGSTLSNGYEGTGKQVRNLQDTFSNAANNGTQGGICGSIHEYLDQAAKALGFESPGITSGHWDPYGNHFVAVYKDPKTGHFYTQNYSRIVDTGKTTVQGAIEVTTQILSPLTGISYAETRPGTFHAYVPGTSSWVQQQINQGTNMNPGNAIISVDAGNLDSQVSIQLQKEIAPDSKVKAFAIHSVYNAPDGKYGLDAVGVAATSEKKLGPAFDKMIDEINLTSKAYGGYAQTTDPNPLTGAQQSRTNLFMGVEEKLTARIDQVTGSLSIGGKTIDFKSIRDASAGGELRAGVGWNSKSDMVKVNAERLYEAVPRSVAYGQAPTLGTAYDKVSVVVDTRGKGDKAYLVMNGSAYAFEGINKNAATGLRAQLQAVIPAGVRGDFVVIADASKVTSNKSKDPFYDTPISTRLGLTWRKAINKALEVGASVDVRKNKMNSIFSDSKDAVVPGISDAETGTKKVASFWLRSTW